MKKIRILFTLLLLAAIGAAHAEGISVSDVSLTPGSQAEIVINCEFSNNDIMAYQFDLYLPEGVTLAKNAKGRYAAGSTYVLSDRHDEHTASLKDNNGFVRFVISNNYKYTLTPGSGELLKLIVDVASSVSGELQASVKNFIMSETNETKHNMNDVMFKMTAPSTTVLATSVTLNQTTATLTNASETLQLIATVLPENASNKSVTWSSNNTSVATISETGIVTAVTNGTATITATTNDGSGKSATCAVTVEISTLPDKPDVEGKTFQLNCARGYVGYNGSTLYGTTQEDASELAFVNYEGKNYLYDVTNSAFVIHTTAAKAGTFDNPSLESNNDFSKAVTGFVWGKTGFNLYPWYLEDDFGNWLQMNALKVLFNTWKDFESGNGGNTYNITIVNTDFDATTAIQILDKYFHPVLATSVTLNQTTATLTSAGETVQLTATILPENASDKSVTWSSNNTGVATVSETGLVTAVANGTATITATANDGSGKSATCEVTVNIPVLATSVTLNQTTATLTSASETIQLTATVLPENASNKSVTWSSNNTSVATVSETGLVTAIANGTATITATTADGSGKSATCEVTVDTPILLTGISLSSSSSDEISQAINLKEKNFGFSVLDAGLTGKASFSLCYWLKVNNVSSGTQFFAVADKAGSWPLTDWGWNWSTLDKAGALVFTYRNSLAAEYPAASKYIYPAGTMPIGVWTHVAIVFDRKSDGTARHKLYINGKFITPTVNYNAISGGTAQESVEDTYYPLIDMNNTVGNDPWMCIGGPASGRGGIDGIVDNFQLWKKAISEEEVQVSMGALDPSNLPAGLSCFWNFENKADDGKGFVAVGATPGLEAGSYELLKLEGEGRAQPHYVDQVYTAILTTLTSVGQTATLIAMVTPDDATNKSVTWTSSDESVATVSETGIVTAVANGTATITATANDGSGKSATCEVTVNIPVLATSVTLNKTTATLTSASETVQLTATVLPENASNKSVTWSSNNTGVATVSETGIVTAVANGTATITATANDGSGKSATCEVTVNIPVLATNVTLNQTTATLTSASETIQLTATVLPENASDKSVTWSSNNTSVATVSETGLVTAIANGTATITATTNDGSGKSATCEVTVNIPTSPDQPDIEGKTFKLNSPRGYIGYSSSHLYLCKTNVANASKFAIVSYEGKNYLYDVTNAAFVVHSTAAKAGTTGNILRESKTDFSKAVTGFVWGKTDIETYPWYLEDDFGNWLQMDSNPTPIACMNTWKDFEGGTGGNTYNVTIVDTDFDATAAIQMLNNYFHPVLATGVTLNQTTATLTSASETLQLIATVLPENASNKSVTWSSNDESVATVSETGLVTAVANGTATITATANDGSGKSATCEVTVTLTTGIGSVLYNATDVWYTIDGRRIQSKPTQSGIYIMNGRKVYVK